MANVVGYSKIGDEGKYDVKICTNDVCEIQPGYYKLQNNDPKTQIFPFPANDDNSSVFIPARIVEDKSALDSYVVAKFLKKPDCLSIDPCNIYTKDLCCTSSTTKNNDNNTNSFTGMMIVTIIMAIIFLIILVGALFYLATNKNVNTPKYNNSYRRY